MTIELRILSGSRAGARERFDQPAVTAGRDPESDLRFDALADLDVSTRHAELREADGVWSVRDRESTNGTFVNGERVAGARTLRTGDVLSFGANGPRVEVRLPVDHDAAAAPVARAAAPSLRLRFGLVPALLVFVGAVGFAAWKERATERERELLALVARSESASVPLRRTIAAMRARDSLFAEDLEDLDAAGTRQAAAGRRIATSRRSASRATVASVSERVEAEARLRESITRLDFARVHDLNDAAIALVASDLDGTVVAGTAFSIGRAGTLVTNRHLMRSPAGRAPRRVRVLFANTTEWLPARLVRVSARDDLALIRLERPGSYPVVAGVRRELGETRIGSPVATIGFPLAVDTPMEGAGLRVRAQTTTTAGMVSKRLDDVLQIDSFAGRGSSGSPVLDESGLVIGVVYGGAAESGGRIVYAVPAERLAAFIQDEAASLLR